MSGVEESQRIALKRQRGGQNRQEGRPAPLYRASWSTVNAAVSFVRIKFGVFAYHDKKYL